MAKRYGLILPDKFKKMPIFEATKNVFGNDDSDEETSKAPIPMDSTNTKRQAKITQAKALDEDPSVYQYDEVYDDIKEKVNEVRQKTKVDKNPKYIGNLLKTAQKRKLENERRIERQVHKEREKEGDEFADKEVFVTSAYKKKLEEMRQEEEKEKYEEYLEQIGDVTKQKDLGGFYRHLYEQKLGTDASKPTTTDNEKQDKTKVEKNKHIVKDEKTKINRNYRKRKLSTEDNADMSDGEIVSDEEINRLNFEIMKAAKNNRKDVNIDADSDFSVNDPSDDDDDENHKETPVENSPKPKVALEDKVNEKVKEDIETKNNVNIKSDNEMKSKNNTEKKEIESPPKLKVDIWKKRTVGVVFEEALKRYYERKASRSG